MLLDELLCNSLKNLSPARNRPRIPCRELLRLIKPNDHDYITAAILVVKRKFMRAFMVKEITISPRGLALESPLT
jgi:hypothetical protein